MSKSKGRKITTPLCRWSATRNYKKYRLCAAVNRLEHILTGDFSYTGLSLKPGSRVGSVHSYTFNLTTDKEKAEINYILDRIRKFMEDYRHGYPEAKDMFVNEYIKFVGNKPGV